MRWADIGCNRVFGLFVGKPEKGEPWHIMKVAGAEPIVRKTFRPVGSSTSPRQRPIRLLMTDDCTAACMEGEFLKSTYSRRLVPVAIKGALVMPRSPDDAGELVSQRHRGLVPTTTLLGLQRPGLQPIQWLAPMGGSLCGLQG